MGEELLQRARALMAGQAVVDTHSHFLINGHYFNKRFERRHGSAWLWNPLRNGIDLPRLREGLVSSPVFTVYVPPPPLRWGAWAACGRILDTLERLAADNAGSVERVDSVPAARAAVESGKLALWTAVEGGHVIGRRAERLEELRRRGVRLLTLTHFIANRICDAHIGPRVHRGLSPFGREVVRECERLGILVDLAHASDAAVEQVLSAATRPLVVTHTALRGERRSQRYLTDDQARAIAATGGAMGVILWPWYVRSGSVFGTLDEIAEAYARLADLVGPEHLLLGSDMDGYTWLPRGLPDVSAMPALAAALLEHGFADAEVRGILGENALRLLALGDVP